MSRVEQDFNFTRDSRAYFHTPLLFLAAAAGNFVRDGKLVFIQAKNVCMFVFLVLTHACLLQSRVKNVIARVAKPQLQKIPIIQFSQKLVPNTINPSEITESTNDNYWFS